MIQKFVQQHVFSLLLFVLVSVVCASLFYIPLLQAFGYEFQFALGILLVFIFPLLARRKETKFSSLASLGAIFGIAVFLAASMVGGIQGKICNFAQSVAFFVLLPLSSVIVSAALLYCSRIFTNKKHTLLLYYGVVLLSILHSVFNLWWEPRIVEFNPFFGYFAGSIYDVSMDVYRAILLYRLGNVWMLSLCIAIAGFVSLRRAGAIKITDRRLCVILFSLFLALSWSIAQARWGIQVDRDQVRRELGAQLKTEHFLIFYDASRSDEQWRSYLANSHEQYYRDLKAFFVLEPSRLPIHSYIYPDQDTKARLMGGARTSVSKVWLNEMHMYGVQPGSTLIKHELAHVFAGEFAPWPLKLAGGIMPRMGWVEGIAVATQWPINEANPHQWASEILAWDERTMAPLFSAHGFWSQPSRKAYTLAGSYVRFLWDGWGAQAVMALSQGEDFTKVIGLSAAEFEATWRHFLQTQYPPKAQYTALSKRYFDKKTIFTQPCARNTASQLDAISMQIQNNDKQSARRALWEMQIHCPQCKPDAGVYNAWMQLWIRAGGESLRSPKLELLEPELLADYECFVQKNVSQAQYIYTEESMQARQSDAEKLQMALKIMAIQQHSAEGLILDYIFSPTRNARRSLLRDTRPTEQSGIFHYLLGTELYNEAHFASSVKHLALALGSGQIGSIIEEDARYKLIAAAIWEKDYYLAAQHSVIYLVGGRSRGRYDKIRALFRY